MRYLISTILLIIVVVLSLMLAYCVYMGLVYNWGWFLVGLGILTSDVVAFLALTAAIPAAKEY